jgi:hypothetical protein
MKPSDQILTLSNVDFRKLGIIVDMGFISAKGIISNDLTSNGVKQLVESKLYCKALIYSYIRYMYKLFPIF